MTVLLEAPHRKGYNNNSVLLCVDLTKGVADEAIRRKDSVVIAYRKLPLPPLLPSIIYISFITTKVGRLIQHRPHNLPRLEVAHIG